MAVQKKTISVPSDLIEQMSQIDGVNWSQVASLAFRVKVAEELARRQTPGGINMDAITQRLRASQLTTNEERGELGFEAGKEWASGLAEAVELDRLHRRRDPTHDWYFGVGSSAYCAGEHFVFMIQPENEQDRQAARGFWEDVVEELGEMDVDDIYGSPDFVHSFSLGAMHIWERVKDKVQD